MKNKFVQGLPGGNYRRTLVFTSLPASYYMIRQLVFVFDHPPLQTAQLEAASTDSLRRHSELCLFMCEYMDYEEQTRQGLLKDEDWTIDDELHENVVKDEWGFALDVISQVLERRIPRRKLA